MPVTHDQAEQIAAEIIAAEAATDQAIIACSNLMATIASVRLDANLSAGTVHGLISRLAKMNGGLAEARGEAVEAHRLLAQLQKLVGLGAHAYGPFQDKPEESRRGLALAPAVAA